MLGGGGMCFGQQARPKQVGQLARIPSVRLDPLSGLLGDQRRCDHHVAKAQCDQASPKSKTQRARFIAALDRTRRSLLEMPGESPEPIRMDHGKNGTPGGTREPASLACAAKRSLAANPRPSGSKNHARVRRNGDLRSRPGTEWHTAAQSGREYGPNGPIRPLGTQARRRESNSAAGSVSPRKEGSSGEFVGEIERFERPRG